MLSTQRLRVFTEVLRRKSFSDAASALSYTQSAVSQAVATLEADVGATLIERDRRGLRPTTAGAVLAEHAEAILARLELAEDDIAAVMELRRGRLRMASFPTAGATLMPVAIASFRSAHPDVELNLAEGEPEEIVPRLKQGDIDLALLFAFHGVGDALFSGLHVVDLLEDPMRVALPAGHPLASKRELRLEELAADAWVQTSAASPCARQVVRSCLASGFDPAVSFESDDYATVQGLVAAGVGVALIPELALSSVREDIAVRALRPETPVRRVFVATARGAATAPAALTMVEVLQATASSYVESIGRAAA